MGQLMDILGFFFPPHFGTIRNKVILNIQVQIFDA